MMKLVFPDITYKERAVEFIREFHEYGSYINGTGSLDRFLREYSYEEWLKKLIRDMDIANIPDGKVPALTYFFVREEDERIVGMVNIRLAMNDRIRNEAGHIGYCIRPAERRRGYGMELLSKALRVCDVIGIREVLVSCDKENAGSAGVIKNCGGVLLWEEWSDTYEAVIQMYAISRG